MTDIIPGADLALVTPGTTDSVIGVQNGQLRRFPIASTTPTVGFATKAAMDADLNYPANQIALVSGDPTPANNGYYRKVGASGTGSWAKLAATVADELLKEWAESEAYEATSLTRNSSGVVTSATVKWPDGSAGTFTATTVNSTFNAIDAYTITHTTSSRKVTQAAVTRNSAGEVTTKPALTVGAA